MKKITSKLTSKYQLTFPKTIRNYLNITDFDFVDFIIDDDGRVVVEKGSPKHKCPICKDGTFFVHTCKVCNGEGFVDEVSKELLMTTLFNAVIAEGVEINFVLKHGINYIKLETNNELLMLYREKIQLEIIKYAIMEFQYNSAAIPEFNKVEELLEDNCSKLELKQWYNEKILGGSSKWI